jgi:hypothetical protein
MHGERGSMQQRDYDDSASPLEPCCFAGFGIVSLGERVYTSGVADLANYPNNLEYNLFKLGELLPGGVIFPFDFGFILAAAFTLTATKT